MNDVFMYDSALSNCNYFKTQKSRYEKYIYCGQVVRPNVRYKLQLNSI